MNRRNIMAWIAALITVPVTAKASYLIGGNQGVPTSTTIEGYTEELKVCQQRITQVLKELVQILDDHNASYKAKLEAANVILDHNHGSSLGPYAWRRLAEIT